MNIWLKAHEKGSWLGLYIQPGASKSEVLGIHGERLKIKIKAPPRDGEANEALIEFLGKFLGVAKSRVSILRGESSRQKDVLVELSPSEIITLLQPLLR